MTETKQIKVKARVGKSLTIQQGRDGVFVEIVRDGMQLMDIELTPNGAYNLYKLLEQYVKNGEIV